MQNMPHNQYLKTSMTIFSQDQLWEKNASGMWSLSFLIYFSDKKFQMTLVFWQHIPHTKQSFRPYWINTGLNSCLWIMLNRIMTTTQLHLCKK